MTPENRGTGSAHSPKISDSSLLWLFSPLLTALLVLGCSRESDSAETSLHAQAQPGPRVIRPAARPNLGYPQLLPPNLSSPAARLPAKVESKLPIYEIRMDPQHLEAMDMNPYAP